MDRAERQSLIAVPLIVGVAAGIAWAGSQHGVAAGGLPLFALCGAVAFVLNWLVCLPSYAWQTERYFDLTGSLTYAGLVVLALALNGVLDARTWLLGGLVLAWAGRLGSFLFARIRQAGADRRFDALKTSLPRFLLTWTLQGLWVLVTASCALAAMTSSAPRPLDGFALVGTLVWAAGFAIEVLADEQKRRFRRDPANRTSFIRSGLWAWSRHPNYFGEIVLWTGIAIVALPVLSGWQHATLISPVFVYVLLTRISGIPLLEARAERKWGDDPEYRTYRERTPVLVPRPPRAVRGGALVGLLALLACVWPGRAQANLPAGDRFWEARAERLEGRPAAAERPSESAACSPASRARSGSAAEPLRGRPDAPEGTVGLVTHARSNPSAPLRRPRLSGRGARQGTR